MSAIRTKATAAAVAAATALSLAVAPAANAAPVFMVKGDNPSLSDWTHQMKYLLDPNTPDNAIAVNLEAGQKGVKAMRIFAAMGRANPGWWWRFENPAYTKGNLSYAQFHQGSPGYPTVNKQAMWKKINGNWRVSNKTMCHYINVEKIAGGTSFCK